MRDLAYQQDYIMRMVTDMVRFLSRIIFDREIPTYEISGKEEYAQSDDLHKNLLALLSKGKINEAEDMIFDCINPQDHRDLKVALDFYNRLNNLDDEYLEKNNFTREEIEEGLRDIGEIAGLL